MSGYEDVGAPRSRVLCLNERLSFQMRRLAAAVLSTYYHDQGGFAEYTVHFWWVLPGLVVWTIRMKARTSFLDKEVLGAFPRCISGFLGDCEGIGSNRGIAVCVYRSHWRACL